MDTQPLMKMKGRSKYTKWLWLPVICFLLLESACERRLLDEDELPAAALIQVKIDWSKSGLNPLSANGSDVHRVSLRFFPKDNNTPVFDLYLEGNVTEGTILVPIGNYSVIVFNESVDDLIFWQDAITFTDVDNYSKFAAHAAPYPDAEREKQFPFYMPGSVERIIAEPIPLASWSLDDFEVTEGMVLVSHGERSASYLSTEENDMLDAFTNVVMRALTRPVNLTGQVENLISMHTGYMAMQGFADKVYMASGQTTQSVVTCMFRLGGRRYDAGGKNGTTSNRLMSFGRITPSGSIRESYTIAADILLVSGERYKPTTPLLFNVTDMVLAKAGQDVGINLNISFKLPHVDGSINVDDWEDEEYTLE